MIHISSGINTDNMTIIYSAIIDLMMNDNICSLLNINNDDDDDISNSKHQLLVMYYPRLPSIITYC